MSAPWSPFDDPEPLPAEVALPEEEQTDSPPASPAVPCWRCKKEIGGEAAVCPFCRAPLSTGTERAKRPSIPSQSNTLLVLIGYYALGVVIILISAWCVQFGIHDPGKNDEATFRNVLPVLVGTDIAYVILVIIAFFHLRSEAQQPPGIKPLQAWIIGFPALGLVLLINYGFHWWLKQVIKLDDFQYPFWGSDLWPWTVLVMCVQPAIAEEVFFRQVVLGTLRRHMSFHGAVWLSALIFALAHLGALLSIPTLLLAGVMFAYLRAATGSLILPMILHFLHNLLVVMFF